MIRTALLLALASVLVGCGEHVRVEVVADDELLAPLREVASAYEQAHAGERVGVVERGRIHSVLHLGRSPDLYLIDYRRLGEFVDAGALAPVPSAADADFFAPALDAFRDAGGQQCVPLTAGTLVAYYNRALFKQLGMPPPKADWTSRDLMDGALKVARQHGASGSDPELYGLGFAPTLQLLASFLWSMDQDLVDDRAQPTHLTLDRPLALRVLSWTKSLNTRLHLVPPEKAHESEDEAARFLRGKLAVLLADRAFTVRARAARDLDWDVAPFPRLVRKVPVLDSAGLCLARQAPHRDAALAFLAFAAGGDGLAVLARSGAAVPARVAVAQSPAFLDPSRPPASAGVFLDQATQARALPRVAAWPEIERRANPLVEEWFFEDEPVAQGRHEEEEEQGGAAAELAGELRERINPLLLPQARPPPKP